MTGKLTSFMVRYNNQLDRTWPYTKVSRIAEVVSSAVNGMDVALESIDADYYFEYIVNLIPMGDKKKKRELGGLASSLTFLTLKHKKVIVLVS